MIRYLWALPATLVGLVAAAAALLLGARGSVVDGCLEVSGGRLERWLLRLPEAMQFGAITLGHVIVGLTPACLESCRAHEHVHVRQYERWGVLFFPLYAGSSLLQWLRGGDPYRDNRFEREAFAKAPPTR